MDVSVAGEARLSMAFQGPQRRVSVASDSASRIEFTNASVAVGNAQLNAAQGGAAVQAMDGRNAAAGKPADMAEMISQVNAKLAESMASPSLQFSVDKKVGIIVKVVDTNTKEVIRQIPPEEMVTLAERMEDMKGLIFNQTG
ncbi:MAG: flagellar protein FlaG [Candidatus Sumerlaeota bacterium]|nr:flagellar protein FlaG [Candidatus Sumerlaeota bacterium]